MNHQNSTFSLAGRTAAVLGVADRDSIAWTIARALKDAGANVIIGYQQKFLSRVKVLLDEEPSIRGQRCDVLNPVELESFFKQFQDTGLDLLVHSVAYGAPNTFTDYPSQVSSLDFTETLEVSSHSLAKVVRFSKPYLKPWSSIITMTFQASQRAMPMYGMMGVAKAALESMVRYLAVELGSERIRINAISAGPVETLAALSEVIAFQRNPEAQKKLSPEYQNKFSRHFPDSPERDELKCARACWNEIQNDFAQRSPIPERLAARDIANCALFFACDASKKVTGQILNVDCGFSACLL
jgi:enoyl-[acyl-carrier protein] reductase I